MQIIECITTKPGLFDNKSIKLDEKLTIIYGENDSGKSLMAKGIIDTLWGGFSDSSMLDKKTWDNLFMEDFLSNSVNKYRLIKDRNESFEILMEDISLGKKYFKETPNIINENDKEEFPLSDLRSSKESKSLYDFFKKIDFISFINISFLPSPVKQNNEKSINYNSFKHLLLNDNVNFYSLYQTLQKRFNHEESSTFNNPILNEILITEGIIKDFDKKIQIIDIQDSRIEKLIRERTLIDEEIKKLSSELNSQRIEKNTLIEILNNLKKLEDITENIQRKEEELLLEKEKIRTITEAKLEIKNLFPHFEDFDEEYLKKLKEIENLSNEIRDKNILIEKIYFERNNRKNNLRNKIITVNIPLFFVIILSIIPDINSIFFKSYFSDLPILIYLSWINENNILIGILILSAILSLFAIIYHTFPLKFKKLKQLMNERSEMEKNMIKLLKDINFKMDNYRLESIYQFLVQSYEEYNEYSLKQFRIDNIKESLKNDVYINDLEERLNQLNNEKDTISKYIEERLITLNDHEFDLDINSMNNMILNKNYRIKDIKECIKSNEKISNKIDEEIKMNKNSKDERNKLIENKFKTKEILDNLNNHHKSISFIAQLLEESVDRREEKQLDKLIESINEKFHYLTNYNYTNTIKYQQIKNIIKGHEFDDTINPSIVHLLHLSIKLALTDFLEEIGLNLPLIIDEPFLFMSNNRIQTIKKILEDISQKRQIIIFTHDSSIRDLGYFIEL